MNIYLKAYLNHNLGDDLFIKILLDRYKEQNFYIRAKKQYIFGLGSNLKSIKKYYLKIISRLLDNNDIFEKYIQKKYDIVVYIGGSIFMQNNENDTFPIRKIYNKNYYVLGANFGPYINNEYIKNAKKIFEEIQQVSFRDLYSYNLFKEIKSVMYASDIVFAMDINQYKNIKPQKIVIFSLIDCNTKCGKEYTQQYENKIIELTEKFLKDGYDIIYMSFCKNENDEIGINRIINQLSISVKQQVQKYYYNGNLTEALSLVAKSEIVVGSRFHANILGMLFNKTVIPFAYSDKTLNILDDINFNGKIIDIRKINEFKTDNLTEEDLSYKQDVSKLICDAKRHFEKLDIILLPNRRES